MKTTKCKVHMKQFLVGIAQERGIRDDFVDRCRSTNTLFLVGLISLEFLKGSAFILFYFVRQFSEHNL